MTNGEDTQTKSSEESGKQSQVRVNIKMQQGEHTGQPIYSNFTAVQPGQGVVFVDFGFLDPQTINALNRMAQTQSDENIQTVNARMSCRIAISIEAANQLTRQLNQLLQVTKKMSVQHQTQQQPEAPVEETVPENSGDGVAAEEKPKSKKGFRFPWSSSDKTH